MRVVDAGGYTAAARAWGRSKAVVSKHVTALEGRLGVQLLRRTTRSMSLTDAGRAYYGRCVDLLGELEALDSSVRDDHARPRGRLRVTAPPGFVERYRSLVTTEFLAAYPDVSLELELTHRMVDLVEEGFDVALRITAPRDSSLVARRLAPAPHVAVASPSYLATHGAPKRPKDLREHACLVDTNFRERGRWRFRVGGRPEVVDVDGPIRVNSPTTVRDLAIEGHGIALVLGLLAEAALADGRLVEVLPGMPAHDWSIFAVYPRRRHLPGRVRAFVDHLARAFADG